ncbi:hypothetical protein DJ70_13095 [Halorubrum halodurans]|uniref:Uncharacterized protein n=1 Tax=Halorubrum halodurans TaxID=1383851 RepID=A0A256IF95_9EURY|nr:hypothetical protein DJ70_13095 [Halorubrum halodurans]
MKRHLNFVTGSGTIGHQETEIISVKTVQHTGQIDLTFREIATRDKALTVTALGTAMEILTTLRL